MFNMICLTSYCLLFLLTKKRHSLIVKEIIGMIKGSRAPEVR